MRTSLKNVVTVVIGLSLVASSLHAAETAKKVGADAVVNPEGDNTKINKRDDAVTSPTADQQDQNKLDVETTRKIRRILTDNSLLSTYAHNIKIITQKGEVVLKGPVRSADEKSIVEAAATKIAGAAHVKSEIEVTSN